MRNLKELTKPMGRSRMLKTYAIQRLWSHGVASCSQNIVNAIQNPDNNHRCGLSIIRQSNIIMEEVLKIKVTKINREANKCVDTLAKFDMNLNGGSLCFIKCTDFMYSLLLDNIISKTVRRLASVQNKRLKIFIHLTHESKSLTECIAWRPQC